MEKNKLVKLFSNMCCSDCKHDFEEDSFFIKRQEKGLMVIQIICSKCGKSFGLAFLGTDAIDVKQNDQPLVFQDCPLPISYDAKSSYTSA